MYLHPVYNCCCMIFAIRIINILLGFAKILKGFQLYVISSWSLRSATGPRKYNLKRWNNNNIHSLKKLRLIDMLVLVISALIFTLVSTILILTCEAFIKLKCFIFLNKMFNLKSNFLNAYFLNVNFKNWRKGYFFFISNKVALKRLPLNVLKTDNLFYFPLFSYVSIVCE